MSDEKDNEGRSFEDLMKSLGFEPVTREELEAEGIDINSMTSADFSSGPLRLCGCGTLHEAYEAGTKHAIQLMAADCPVWAFQVGTMIVMNALKLLREGISEEGHKEAIAAATLMCNIEFQKHPTTAAELEAECMEKRAGLGL